MTRAKDAACIESTLSADCPNPCGGFGFFDGYNCYAGSPPADRTATPALCGPATDWQNLQRAPGRVTVQNVCEP